MSVEDQPKDQATNADTEEAKSSADQATPEAETAIEATDTAAAAEPEDTAPVEPASDELKAEVEAMREKVIRAQADMQNLRRRCEKDVEQAHKFGQERLIKELLPVLDNFERAIDTAPEGKDTTVLDGIKMTKDGMLTALAKFEVVQVDPMGVAFDPTLHQAVSIVDNADVEPNTVITVMQKGYTLNGRLVRPAMVMVSK